MVFVSALEVFLSFGPIHGAVLTRWRCCRDVLVFESAIFFLTVYKAFTMGSGIRLLNVIVRDNVSYSTLFRLTAVIILHGGLCTTRAKYSSFPMSKRRALTVSKQGIVHHEPNETS